MKTVYSTTLFTLLAVATSVAASFTYETPTELTSFGDFDNNGRRDAVLVDRATGLIRLGLQQADGTFQWAAPEPSGFGTPTSLSVGRFGGSGAGDQIALVEPVANRATLLTLPAANVALAARHVYPKVRMPHGLTALDYDTNGTDDLVIYGKVGGGRSPYYERLISGLNSSTPSVGIPGRDSASRTHHAFPFVRKADTSPVALVIRSTQISMAPASSMGFDDGIILSEVVGTDDMLMAWGCFDGSDYPHVLLYRPGETNLVAAQVAEPEYEEFDWNASETYTFSKPILLVVTIPLASGARLAVLFCDGTVGIFDFNGSDAPAARSTLTGTDFDWLLPLGTDALLSGRGNEVQRWNTVTGGLTVLTPMWSNTLPALRESSRYSNVVFVKGEPFVKPTASAVGTAHVLDWTTGVTYGGSTWTVQGMTQGSGGLATPANRTCQPPALASFALVNQYAPNISIHILESSVGAPLPGISFSPPAGTYPTLEATESFSITLVPTPADAKVYFRLAPNGFWGIRSTAMPVTLSGNATIEGYAESADESSAGPIQWATYTFTDPLKPQAIESVDADSDGMPDELEKTFGISDPLADDDGDGVSNLQECLDRTDPRDPHSSALAAPFLLAMSSVGEGGEGVRVLEWALAHANAKLMCTDDLQEEWQEITEGIEQTAYCFRYVIPLTSTPALFFRLQKP